MMLRRSLRGTPSISSPDTMSVTDPRTVTSSVPVMDARMSISSPPSTDGPSKYELERLENIARNNAKLAELNLLDAVVDMRASTKSKPSSRGVKAKRERVVESAPPRRSERRQKVEPSHGGGIASERSDGTITLASGEVVRTLTRHLPD